MHSSECESGNHVGIDEAIVTVSSALTVSVWSQSDECSQCPLVYNGDVLVNQSKRLTMDTTFSRHIVVIENNNTTLCDYTRQVLVDQGDYQLNVSEDGLCSFSITNSPMNSNLPVFIALSLVFAAILLWVLTKYLYKRGALLRCRICVLTQRLINADLGGSGLITAEEDGVTVPPARTGSRIHSVDTLRGFSLMLMVFVNYGGGGYWYFRHSVWNGLTVADLVFPWFVFVMGTSIALSFNAARRRRLSLLSLLMRILRRTAILFILGLVVSNRDVDVRSVRVFGVLQRLALTYCVVASTELCCPPPAHEHAEQRCRAVRDLILSWPLWLVTIALLVIHTSLTFLLGVPGCPRGYLGPGGLQMDGKYANCTGGAAGYIDRLILTESHMYQHATCKRVYNCTTAFDSNGILGTMTSVIICILGVQAGRIMITYQTRMAKNVRWIAWAIITGVVGGSLCNWSQEDGLIPINKNLWSLSYVLVTSSMAFVLVTTLYNIVDIDHLWNGAPFTYLGMNSIVIYVCHEVFQHYFPIQFHVTDTHAALLAIDIWGTSFWLIVATYLYHKNIFVAI